ncbi:MAG: InlB B-repeat-containing protein [Treponema sp.]|jgi:uncharacterized repeat protein (TIGR02543 family)|nr:InlB B-repeat-containing protein [Treponema sp.]
MQFGKFKVFFGLFLTAVFCLLFAACSLGTDIEELRDRVREREREKDEGAQTEFTVTFDSNGATGGTVPDAVTASSSITLPDKGNLVKTGYTFGGWNTNANGGGSTYTAGSAYTATADVTLYAKWESVFIVTFDSNGATGGIAPFQINSSQNAHITLPDKGSLSRTGYTFGGWSTNADGSGTTYAAGSSYMVTGYITLYAKWNPPGMFTVIFDTNSTSGTAPDAQTVSEGSVITLPNDSDFSKSGYTFGGWNTDAEGSGVNYPAGFDYTVAANVTFYAKWAVNRHTVTFDTNGAAGTAPIAQTADYSTDITLPNDNGFTKGSNTFGGWSTDADGSGITYAAGSSFTVTADITLYAKWNPPGMFTVIFNINSASGTAPDSQTVAGGSAVTLPDSGAFSKPGHTFGGWNTNSDGNGTIFETGSSYTVTANFTLYAKWNINIYTVTFDTNGAAGTAPAAQTAYYNTGITLPNDSSFSNPGYTFGGWNTNVDSSGETYTAGSHYTVTSGVTLYAIWNPPGMFTVIFDINNGNGTAPEAQTVTDGSAVTLPNNSAFSRPGHTFDGWNTNADGNGVNYPAGHTYTVTANFTLYAKWNIHSYTAVFDINGAASGTAPTVQTADYNTGITLPNDSAFSKPGYTFGGWNTNTDGSGTTYAAGSSYTVTGNVTLYAKWEHTVTFNANGAADGTAPAAMSVNPNAGITLPGQGNLVRNGFTFGGWNTAANGSGTTYTAGSSYTVTGNTTLYVRWEPVSGDMVWINSGTFQRNGYTITLTSGFYMGRFEVTQEQYQAVMGINPSNFKSNQASGEIQSKRPVEQVSWYSAIVFCNKLSIAEGLTPAYRINNNTNPSAWGAVPTSSNATWNAAQVVAGSTGYRLPTEAQWEYACRAGTTTTWSFGNNESDFTNHGWYSENSSSTHEVGMKLPNAWGLYDMHGNVWEWCWDWYGSLPNAAQTDPTGASSGSYRVFRGGRWGGVIEDTSSANRFRNNPYYTSNSGHVGFRLVRP